jgi:hypothetical protein
MLSIQSDANLRLTFLLGPSLKHVGISTYVGDRDREMTPFNVIGGDQWGSVETQDSQVKIEPICPQESNSEQRDCAVSVYHVGQSL